MHNNLIIQLTEDGSHTIAIPELNITYHSRHGAIQESLHVFINAGLDFFVEKNHHKTIHIFEVGFGTGLNTLLSLEYAINHNKKIIYQTIEPYPISIAEANHLNYADLVSKNLKQNFYLMHACDWNKKFVLHNLFSFQKIKNSLHQFETSEQFHVIYFDAFDPNAQPELWTETIFRKMFSLLYSNGIVVTYSSKGSVQRAMKAAGFSIKKIKGPPGKREIIRALKT